MLHEGLALWYAALSPWVQTLVTVVVVFFVGLIVIKTVKGIVKSNLERSPHIESTLKGFIGGLVEVVGWLLLIVVVLGVAGVDVAALVGGLAIGGFIIGFALKDTLGNLAAGVMLLFYRPFKVDETVTIDGMDGTVVRLSISLTTLKCADGRLITIPNGSVLGGAIVNHTREPLRRADVLVGIGYDDDIDTAVRAIMDALKTDARVLAEPEPGIRLTDLGDNAVGLQVRPWVKTEDYWQAKADFVGVVKRALDAAGCSIPYPQRDVHVYTEASATPEIRVREGDGARS